MIVLFFVGILCFAAGWVRGYHVAETIYMESCPWCGRAPVRS